MGMLNELNVDIQILNEDDGEWQHLYVFLTKSFVNTEVFIIFAKRKIVRSYTVAQAIIDAVKWAKNYNKEKPGRLRVRLERSVTVWENGTWYYSAHEAESILNKRKSLLV